MHILNIINNQVYNSHIGFVGKRVTSPKVQFDARQNLYKDIDAFLKQNIDKKTYLTNLDKMIKQTDNFDGFTAEEKDYIYTIITAVDDLGGTEKLPSSYITKLMKDLLATTKYNTDN